MYKHTYKIWCKYIKNTWIAQESENTYFHCGPVNGSIDKIDGHI